MRNSFFRNSVIFALLVLSGCTGFINEVKIDDAAAARLRAEVLIYDSARLSGLTYQPIKSINAATCSDREHAMDQLRYIADSVGANGITKINCGNLLGPSMQAHCVSSVLCEALAIRVVSNEAAEIKVAPEKVNRQAEKQIIVKGIGFTLGKLPVIVTNYDAVGESKDVEIIFPGNQTAKAKTIKRDKENNLAIITFDEFRGEPAGFQIFPSHKIRPGQDVYIISYPLGIMPGENPNVTKGVVSATEGLNGDCRYFSIVAHVDERNGGGPLLDDQGRVIGILSPTPHAAYDAGKNSHIPEGTVLAIKSDMLLNLYPGVENLIDPGNGGPISVRKMFEIYAGSVVNVIAK